MAIEIPLFLLPAFAGVPATPPEKMAIKRAKQRIYKLFPTVQALWSGELLLTNPDVVANAIADANRTLRAIDHALNQIARYEAMRPHPTEKEAFTGLRKLVEGFKEDVLEP